MHLEQAAVVRQLDELDSRREWDELVGAGGALGAAEEEERVEVARHFREEDADEREVGRVYGGARSADRLEDPERRVDVDPESAVPRRYRTSQTTSRCYPRLPRRWASRQASALDRWSV